jgi:hypothetical protein
LLRNRGSPVPDPSFEDVLDIVTATPRFIPIRYPAALMIRAMIGHELVQLLNSATPDR